ncbi:unnamed protein product [Pleuronectes platessa]|uniref:Uncharacterized protein n=1 Tax=Pleuronectes platessa TaxID=8262 RepID=A0A9N7UM29_PLEPL|nr:unnamed protein product [Pleuronectes platessa]
MEIKTETSKIDFSSHGVTVAWHQVLITRHQNTRETRKHLFLPEETQAENQTITFTFQTKLNQTRPNVLSESSYRREESNYNLPTLHTLTLHLETQWLPD